MTLYTGKGVQAPNVKAFGQWKPQDSQEVGFLVKRTFQPTRLATALDLVTLATELTLLVATFLLVFLSRREALGRGMLLKNLISVSKAVSRQEYFSHIVEGMQGAVNYVQAVVTGTAPVSAETTNHVMRITEQIRAARKRSVAVQYLMPKSQDRISLAHRYREAGAEVRFHSSLLLGDMTYTIFDGNTVVIGLPLVVGEGEPIREGFRIPSEGIVEIFRQQFEAKWKQGTDLDQYLHELLLEAGKANPHLSRRLIANQLGVPESEIAAVPG